MNPVIIEIELETNNHEIEFEVTESISGGTMLPWYEGTYEVIPKRYDQTLDTDNKSMHEDVVVKEIQSWEVGNLGGGMTLTIGD